VQLVIDVALHVQDHHLADRDLDLPPVRSILPLGMVVSIVSVDGLAAAVLAADPPLVVRPLKIRHSASTPSRNAVPASVCRT
jgi:hypothetical protein